MFHFGAMAWSEEQLDKIRDRLSLAKRQGVWLSAQEIWVVLDIIQFWRRSTRLVGHDGIAQGAMPTIGHARSHGITCCTVTCRRIGCGSRRRFSFEDLRLTDDVVFVQIAEVRHFVCQRCRGREVIVSADWPTYRPPR